MRSPIFWFGGKGKMVQKLLPLLPATKIYIEVFGGGASMLCARRPSPIEVYNDIDRGLYDFFTVLADPELFEQFYHRVALLPYCRQLYNDCRENWQGELDKIKRVAMWFVIARQSFGGCFGRSWGYNVSSTKRGMVGSVSRWLSCLDGLPQVHARLQCVQIECSDWRTILATYDTTETLFYLDPPYVPTTRRAGGYAHEMTEQDHRELIEVCLQAQGKICLSGYASEIYTPLETAGWERQDFKTVCHAAGRTRGTNILGEGAALNMQSRTESTWMNYSALPQLNLF